MASYQSKRNLTKDRTNWFLPLMLMSTPLLSACGGGGSISTSNPDDNAGDNQSSTNDVASDAIGSAPTLAPLPNELAVGETDLGTVYIDDESPDTVQVAVTNTGEYAVQISSNNEISLISSESVSVGDTISFKITATDETGLVTEVSYSVEVVNIDPELPTLDVVYEAQNNDEIVLKINVPLDASGGDGLVGGMQFDVQFDPSVFTYTEGSIESIFSIVIVNSNMADQGLLRVTMASLNAEAISENALIDLTLNTLSDEVNSTIQLYRVEVDELDLGVSNVNIIA